MSRQNVKRRWGDLFKRIQAQLRRPPVVTPPRPMELKAPEPGVSQSQLRRPPVEPPPSPN